jgi:hypothetical protein
MAVVPETEPGGPERPVVVLSRAVSRLLAVGTLITMVFVAITACGDADGGSYGGEKSGSFQIRCGYEGKKIC